MSFTVLVARNWYGEWVSFVNITLNIGYGTGSELFLVAGIRIRIWNADPHTDPGVKTTL